jgi:MarR family transcriptional repressor of emrRAB
MNQFSISDDGFVSETDAHDLAEHTHETFPWVNVLAIEASMMLTRAYQSHAKVHGPTQEEFGLSGARFSVLRVIYQNDHAGLTMNQIAKGLLVTASNITKLIDGLVQDGLVERVVDAEDRRAVRVQLTETGRQRFEAIRPNRFRRIQEEFSGLDEREKRMFIHLLAKLRMTSAAKPVMMEPKI